MKSVVYPLKSDDLQDRRDALFRYLLLLFLLISFLFINHKSLGQCEMKFEYEVENCTEGKKDGKIYLKSILGQEEVTLKIIDLPTNQLVGEKKIIFIKDKKILTFENLDSSAYVIYVFKSGCKIPISIGDKFGILISRP